MRAAAQKMTGLVMLFAFCAGLLLMLRSQPADLKAAIVTLALPGLIWLITRRLGTTFIGDPLLVAMVLFLCSLGVLLQYSVARRPVDELRHALYCLGGFVIWLIASLWVRFIRNWRGWQWPLMLSGILLIALPLLIPSNDRVKNWVYIGSGFQFQPSEIVKVLLVLSLAIGLSSQGGLRKQWPCLIFAVGCLAILFRAQDLGTAMIYYLVTLLTYYVATSNLLLTLAGGVAGIGAAMLAYQKSPTVWNRVAMWRNPWSDPTGDGQQIVQGLMAIASGGLRGMGFGLGRPRAIAEFATDYVFAVICEQFGIVFGVCVLAVYVLIVVRGLQIAQCARTRFLALLAVGSTLLLGIQTFIIVGGVIGLIPLTGVTMPFVSAGGTSLFSCMALVGILCGVAARNKQDILDDERLTGRETLQ